MMLFKMSLRNARRQAGDYLVFFATIIMAGALTYAFNGLVFSQEIRELSSWMESLDVTVILADAAMMCIIGWLVSYTTNFMLIRRSREFGTYILMGMENKQAARLFFLENMAVGGCALAIGIPLGNLIFQALRAVLMTLFGSSYTFSFSFSLKAVGVTVFCFLLIYLFAQLKSRKRIRSMKICDLIYYERRNEEMIIKTSGRRRKIFVISIMLGIAGTLLLLAGDFLFGLIGAACIIVFLYGFFVSFSSGVPAYFEKHPGKKYRGRTLIIFRTLSAKLAAIGVVMATISLLFTAVLISQGTGLTFSDLFRNRAAQTTAFDLFIGIDSPDQDFDDYLKYINANIPVTNSRQYNIYRDDGSQVTEYIEQNNRFFRYYDYDSLMKYSDYAALREMLGYSEVKQEPGGCIIHCSFYLREALVRYDQPVTVAGVPLVPSGVYTEYFNQYSWDGNGGGFILVVPDELAEGYPVSHRIYVAMTDGPVGEEQFSALRDIRNDDKRPEYDVLYGKDDEEREAASMIAVIVFPLYYLALVLTMTAAAILIIHQLSETDRYRRQFELLRKLGMDRRTMAEILWKQSAVYYAMPALPPAAIAVPFIMNVGSAVEPGIMVGASHPVVITGISLALFFLIYTVYILLAVTSLKRNVLPEQ